MYFVAGLGVTIAGLPATIADLPVTIAGLPITIAGLPAVTPLVHALAGNGKKHMQSSNEHSTSEVFIQPTTWVHDVVLMCAGA